MIIIWPNSQLGSSVILPQFTGSGIIDWNSFQTTGNQNYLILTSPDDLFNIIGV